MPDQQSAAATPASNLPADDPLRKLAIASADEPGRRHLGVAGDTYTILISGSDTAGRFCVIDMYVPRGGGPPPHRHEFEEAFTILEGEIQAVFRGEKVMLRAGQSLNIPSNAPHYFRNLSQQPARLLCICAPAGLDEFFMEIGVPVDTRTSPPPKPSEAEQAAAVAKLVTLAPKYRTELLEIH